MDKIHVLGVGGCGTKIAENFSQYDTYSVQYIDNEKHNWGEGNIVPKINSDKPAHEEYDSIDYNWDSIEIDEEEVHIFVSGASDVSGIMLQLIENLKKREKKVTVFYIKPENKFATKLQKLQDKVTFGILQEYARSGLLENMLIFDNGVMGQLIGKTSIADYFPSINEKITQFVHTWNFCSKNNPIFGQRNEFLEITRLSCLGYGSLEQDIHLFYDLKSTDGEVVFPLEIQYYFLVPEEMVKDDDDLMTKILELVEKEEEKYKSISYGVYEISAEQEDVTVLVYLKTSKIQTQQ